VGFEGLAITPDGKTLYAVLQDPLVNEPTPNNGRNGRNLRIVAFDNDRRSGTFGTRIAQYAYQLEAQADVAARIIAAGRSARSIEPTHARLTARGQPIFHSRQTTVSSPAFCTPIGRARAT
jgi:hypothetical protein